MKLKNFKAISSPRLYAENLFKAQGPILTSNISKFELNFRRKCQLQKNSFTTSDSSRYTQSKRTNDIRFSFFFSGIFFLLQVLKQ